MTKTSRSPRIPKKPKLFSRRHDVKASGSNVVDVTDYVAHGQCKKKTGPHGLGMDLLQQQVPAIASYNAYDLRTMRWKKNRGLGNTSSTHVRRQDQKTIRISPVKDAPPPGCHMYYRWDGDKESQLYANSFLIPASKLVCINDWRVIDAFENGRRTSHHTVVFDIWGKFLFALVAPRQCATHLGGKERQALLRENLDLVAKVKPEILRGKKRAGKCTAYPAHGVKKDPLGNDLAEYAFKPSCKPHTRKIVDDAMRAFALGIERSTRSIDSGLVESRAMVVLKAAIALPSNSVPYIPPRLNKGVNLNDERRFSTALAIGKDYWSVSHTDSDIYLTSVTFCAGDGVGDHDDVIHNFVFPQYGIRVPMRSGQVLVFNPTIEHCCSNPRRKGTFSASNYNALGTTRERAASHFGCNGKKK